MTRNLVNSVYLLEYLLALDLATTNLDELLRDMQSRKALAAKIARYSNYVENFDEYLQLLMNMKKPSSLLVLTLMPAIVTSLDISDELPEKIAQYITMPFMLFFMQNSLASTLKLNKDTVSVGIWIDKLLPRLRLIIYSMFQEKTAERLTKYIESALDQLMNNHAQPE